MAFNLFPAGVPTIGQQVQQIKANNDPTNSAWVRDYLKNTYQVPDAAIGWDAKNNQIMINNNPFAVQGLTLNDGKSYAPTQNIDTAFKTMFPEGYKDPNQFRPTYRDEQQGIINDVRKTMDTGFQAPVDQNQMMNLYNQMLAIGNQQYDPTKDTALSQAQNQAMLAVQNRMAGSGMLFGDTTKAMMAQEAQKLVSEYTKMFYMNQERQLNNLLNTGNFGRQINADAYTQYTDNINNMMNMYDMYDKFDTNDFNVFKENVQLMRDKATSDIQQREIQLKEEEIKYNRARERVEDLGYVDNAASVILGLPVGTKSKTARERIEANEDFIMQENVRLKNDLKVIDAQTRKTMATMSAKEKATDPFTNATEEQKWWYNELMGQFYGDKNQNQNVDSALLKATQNEAGYRKLLGNDLYEYLLKQVQTVASKMPTYKEPTQQTLKSTDYKTNPDFSEEVAWINANPETALTEIKNNSQNLISAYGTDGYNYLLKLAEAE